MGWQGRIQELGSRGTRTWIPMPPLDLCPRMGRWKDFHGQGAVLLGHQVPCQMHLGSRALLVRSSDSQAGTGKALDNDLAVRHSARTSRGWQPFASHAGSRGNPGPGSNRRVPRTLQSHTETQRARNYVHFH